LLTRLKEDAVKTPVKLFLASFLALYFELVVIRYVSTEIRVFAYLKNLPLIASFLGLGLGMVLGKLPKGFKRFFPYVAALLFLIIAYASALRLTHLRFPFQDYFVFGSSELASLSTYYVVSQFVLPILGVVALIVAFFTTLGGLVGENLAPLPALRGYGINLAGSLAGILFFTCLSYLDLPPIIWVLVGFLAAIPFFRENWVHLVVFGLAVIALGWPRPGTYWSPYYLVEVFEVPPPTGWHQTPAYFVTVNHDYHQKIVDLSPDFVRRFPDFKPNAAALSTYELPYRIADHAQNVLVVGSGTGNDVAAALRHGATHVDAVEIDPVILRLGKELHPEQPYDSPRVTAYNDDARAFMKKTQAKYDLIVFGYLDSHTLLTSLSSVRLDNYVYTEQSFEEAKQHLNKDGTLVVAFGSGTTFVTVRMAATLQLAFGAPPRNYLTNYDGSGVVLVEGKGRDSPPVPGLQQLSVKMQASDLKGLAATDQWPFLYLKGRRIPNSILIVLIPFLMGSAALLFRMLKLHGIPSRHSWHLFFLGAGFLLLEAKGVTEVALLFGSTWVVNAVVIAAFLVMALLANTLVIYRPVSIRVPYAGLFAALLGGVVFHYSALEGLQGFVKVLAAAGLVGVPVFFSGLVFSRSFRNASEPAKGLGFNLLGAMLGGALENVVMIGGTPVLGWLAIGIYGISAIFLMGKRS
jgi:SAM-dependent methyltransferase